MSYRDSLALSLAPLLIRLGLGITFLWAGVPKFAQGTFEGHQAQVLTQMNVGTPAVASPAATQSELPATSPEIAPPDDEAAAAADVSAVPPVRARQLHHITVMLSDAGHPFPKLMAWVAAITEALGGALLIVGLLSRIWGAGLAVAMGYAFYLGTLPQIRAHIDPAAGGGALGQWWKAWNALPGVEGGFVIQSGAMFQMVLFLAALSIFFGGPGRISLDRLLFGHPRRAKVVEVQP